jgi:hypothetical protein
VIEDTVINGEMRSLTGGRTAYWWNDTVVIRNPGAVDGGTAFRPVDGYSYFTDTLNWGWATMHTRVFTPEAGPPRIVLIASREEVAVLMSCIGETHEALDDWEFQTRVGVTRDVTERMRAELRAAFRELPPEQ